MQRMLNRTNNTDSTRLERVYESSSVYIWSLRHQSLLNITRHHFSNGQWVQCEFCIPKYKLGHGLAERKMCDSKFKTFSQLIYHVLILERTFRRELLWPNESEIPMNLFREREIGDLSTLENEPILRLEFEDKTLIHYQNVLRKYFRVNGCPCRRNDVECRVHVGISHINMFGHLSGLEKEFRKYIVFKASVSEITNNDPFFENCVLKKGRPIGSTQKKFVSSTQSKPLDSFNAFRRPQIVSNVNCESNSSNIDPSLGINAGPTKNSTLNADLLNASQVVKRKRGRPAKIPQKCAPPKLSQSSGPRRGRPPKNSLNFSPSKQISRLPGSDAFSITRLDSFQSTSGLCNIRTDRRIIEIMCQGRSVSVDYQNRIRNVKELNRTVKLEFVFNDGVKIVETVEPESSDEFSMEIVDTDARSYTCGFTDDSI